MARCKYNKREHQISYDNGVTWTELEVIKGSLIEYGSSDCPDSGSEITKWVDIEGDYICEDKNKYKKQILYISYDGGSTWYIFFPTVYQKGQFVGVDEDFCNNKFEGHYEVSGDTTIVPPKPVDPLKIVKCNGNTTLTREETQYYNESYTQGGVITSFSGTLISCKIGDCVTAIDNEAIGVGTFQHYYNLSGITIPNSVTKIGNYTFQNCYSLSSITIPNSVTSLGEDSFRECINLTRCTLGNGLTSISGGTFRDCINLSNVNIPSGVTTIGNAAFYRCSGLTSIDIPSSVTSIGTSAFTNCSGLTSLELSDNVTTIGDSAYYGCSSLSSVTIGSGVTSIGYTPFWNCPNLQTITIHATTPPSLNYRIIGSTYGHEINTQIYVPCESVAAYQSANGWSYDADRIHGIPPCVIPKKFTATYLDSTEYEVECTTSTTISQTDTKQGQAPSYTTMTSAVIGDCITTIDQCTFCQCSSLSSITIPNSVTNISSYAFEWDGNLKTVNMSNSVTVINREAFSYCSGMTSIDLPSTLSVISASSFSNCSSLTSVTIPSGVTRIGDAAFSNCTSLTSITVLAETPPTLYAYDNWDYILQRNFENTNECPIYVPCESYSAYTSAYGWNKYASRIHGIQPCTEPTVSAKLTATYNDSSSYFIGCYGNSITSGDVKTVTIPKQYSAMTDAVIGDCVNTIEQSAFSGCKSLTSVTIPNSVSAISSGSFSSCSAMTSINIPSGVTKLGESVFSGCKSLSSVTIPNSITSISARTFQGCTSLTSVGVIGSGASVELSPNTTKIGDSVFWGCSGLTNVSIPNRVTNIGGAAFSDCNKITNISIPDSVTNIQYYAFQRCTGLTNVYIGTGVTRIREQAFYGCSSITSMTINATTPPTLEYDNDTETFEGSYPIYVPCGCANVYKSNRYWRYYSGRIQEISGCENEKKVEITYANTAKYTVQCSSSRTLTNSDVTGGTQVKENIISAEIGNCTTSLSSAFYGCTNLQSVTFSSGVTDIGYGSFYSCTSLTSLVIPSGVTSIGDYAFQDCSGLTSINIPNSVTSIGQYAFQNCTNFTSINIPSGVTSIGGYAFRYCSNLISITINATTPPTLGTNAFSNTNDSPIFVPAQSLDAYKAASGWSSYTSRIYAIPTS